MSNPFTILILGIVAVVTGVIALYFELRRDLMMLQQNSYRPERYYKWIGESGDTTSGWKLCGLVAFFASMASFKVLWGAIAMVALFNIILLCYLASRKYKKPLAVTKRVWRIGTVSGLLSLLIVAGAILLFGEGILNKSLYCASVALLGIYCGSHIIILMSVWILMPVEKNINRKFYNRASSALQSMPGLKIVGITGSYGKTSTKHYLTRILSEKYSTLMTPGSYNTTLGVVRTVNELLKPYHEVFVVEMGAKQLGDIKEICDLVHPEIGILTAVGPQHLATFGNIENVRRTKFELIDSLPTNGLAVINNDFEQIANRKVENVPAVRYAVENQKEASARAENVTYTREGTTFTVVEEGKEPLDITTRLLGECNVSDLLAAIVVARHLEVPDKDIQYAVSCIEPVLHRLSTVRTAGGITIIDDAYNSNPHGSRMALDVLSHITGGRRIVVTPGMIELGEKQHELNRDFGRHAGHCADKVIVVGEYNRDSILEGLRESPIREEDVIAAESFKQALAILSQILKSGDTVLYENDLPDTYK